MFALLNPKLLIALALAGALAATHFAAYRSGKAAVHAAWDADIAKRVSAALEAEQQARAKEQELQGKAAAIRRTKDAQIQSLGLELSESLQRLRNRPQRPVGDVPAVAGTGGGGCTPSQLYREDAGLALQIAADADKLRIGLEACQAAYRNARAVAR